MATVTPDERRILMDFFGLPSDAIDDMSETKAARGLEQYHAAGKLAIYDASPPLPDTLDWISEGLQQSVSLEGIERAWQERGATWTLARQVGTDLAESATDLLPDIPSLKDVSFNLKLALVAIIFASVAIVVFKVG